jgi:hypothetical protein
VGIPILGDIIDAVKDVASEVIVDKDKRNELQVRLEELRDRANQRDFELAQGQIEVNKEEAKHSSVFVAGWRPAVGWVGVFALAYIFVIMPFMSFIARTIFEYQGGFPVINGTEQLMLLLFGILGIGGMRTLEKVKGVSSDTMADAASASRNIPASIPSPAPVRVAPLPEVAPWAQ